MQKFLEIGHANGADRVAVAFVIVMAAAVVAGWWWRRTR
jgi:hypothetical protein